MNKKKVLFVTESTELASGFGTYAKEVLKRLHDSGKYEIAEFSSYRQPESVQNSDWLIYGNAPMNNEKEYAEQHKNPVVQWGIQKFDLAVLDFKPDIVVTYRDPWMDAYVAESPYLPFFHWVWMPTIDSEPQKNDWLYDFNRCDGLMAYSEYGIRTLEKQTNGRLKVHGCASPAIDPVIFNIIPNKESHKESLGLPSDSIIFGTVMRNQKRKMFPDLMKAFKTFLDTTDEETRKKSFLYLHTSYPEKMGWNITSLIHEYGIGSKVLCTYVCRACKQYFCCHYRDALTTCNKCGRFAASLPSVQNGIDHPELKNIYNAMDLYIQYAICEGFGMPQVEAAACGTPIASINYSAMEDVVSYTDGYPIEPILQREMETNADRSNSNNKALVEAMVSFAKQTKEQKKQQRLNTRNNCIKRYTWDIAAKSWEEYLDQADLTSNLDWDHPPLMKQPPKEYPKNLSNMQFCEWVYAHVLQDTYHMFNYKMLSHLRNLNFGATIGAQLEPCVQDTVFKEIENMAIRRLSLDNARCSKVSLNEGFIKQAHKGLRK